MAPLAPLDLTGGLRGLLKGVAHLWKKKRRRCTIAGITVQVKQKARQKQAQGRHGPNDDNDEEEEEE